jgi:hypothetical protein
MEVSMDFEKVDESTLKIILQLANIISRKEEEIKILQEKIEKLNSMVPSALPDMRTVLVEKARNALFSLKETINTDNGIQKSKK